MARNKITDLRDHLFAQLERLSDDNDMKNPIKREAEIQRSKAISEVSQSIINTAKLEVDYLKALSNVPVNQKAVPNFLQIETPPKKID